MARELTAHDAAARLGILPRQVRNVARKLGVGEIRYGRWLFTKSEVNRMGKRPNQKVRA